ncbi:hypothetical protein T484DRAFT_1786768 [Baffinella frigidus]|nr:hypothetical protein T484DRAFT_1786768 [Cryptophyta sp. CCMP2293]
MPVDVRLARMLVYAAVLGVTEPALTIAATLSSRSPFLSPFEKRQEADRAKRSFSRPRLVNARVTVHADAEARRSVVTALRVPFELLEYLPSQFQTLFIVRDKSDHILCVRAFEQWEAAKQGGGREERSFCEKNFLSSASLRTINDLRSQFREPRCEDLAELGAEVVDNSSKGTRKAVTTDRLASASA